MLYHCFHELKEDYQTIMVSVTEIEQALNTQPEFMQIKDNKKLANTFWVGNLVENIVWNRISMGADKAQHQIEICRRMMDKERMRYYSPSGVEDKQFTWLYDWLEQISNLVANWESNSYDIRNLRSAVEVAFSWYKVIITWEIDWGIDWEMLFDCKTAKKKWNEEEKWTTSCYQARFYSWMHMLSHPELDKIPFTYLVITKQKTPQLQEITKVITRDEAEQFVREKLFNYLVKVKNWEIVPTEWSIGRM